MSKKKNFLKNSIYLVTTHSDEFINEKKRKKFFLGLFCMSDSKKLSDFNEKNTLETHWTNRKNIINKYQYLKKVSLKLFKVLSKELNKIHKRSESENYWKIIIFPWVCYYVYTLFDRWETISQLKKEKKNTSFFTYEYVSNNKFLQINDTLDWVNKSQTNILNNNLYIKILKYRKFKNIKILHKKYFKEKEEHGKNLTKKINFLKIIDQFLSKIGLYFNQIYFDKYKIKKSSFLSINLKYLQIPTINSNTFEKLYTNTSYDYKRRKFLNIDVKNKIGFETFLYKEIKNYLPKSFLENFEKFIDSYKKLIKKKRSFIGMYSIHFNDYFKIFLAESKLLGSRYIHADHGAGIHVNKKYDTLYNHFDKISDKIIIFSKEGKRNNKEVYLGSDLFNSIKKVKYSNEKLLINYHDSYRYEFRPPVTTPSFHKHVKNFGLMVNSLENLNKPIKKNIRFRPKEEIGLNSLRRFGEIFGENSIEQVSEKKFSDSISESRLVVCFVPQTSFTECIQNNIPTILVGNKSGFFDTPERIKLLKKFKSNNVFFDDMDKAVRFINKNWKNIFTWWNSRKTQSLRKLYLSKYYKIDYKYKDNWKSLIKNEIKILSNNYYLK